MFSLEHDHRIKSVGTVSVNFLSYVYIVTEFNSKITLVDFMLLPNK